jgi:ribosome-associated toxin RatA of RatAB toxin-antitoxin module
MRRTLLLIALIAMPTPAARAADSWQQALDRGEILVYSESPKADAAAEVVVKAVIDTAPSRVWDLVSRCGRYAGTMPRINAARELSRKGSQVTCRVTVDMPFPYSDLTSTTRVVHDEQRAQERFSRRWELIDGDYKVNRGSWSLAPFRGDRTRTLVIYRAQALPKAWIPDWVRRAAQRRSLPKMIQRIRELTRKS